MKTAVLPVWVKHVRIFVVALAVSLLMAMMPAPAHAQELSAEQMDAVVALLEAFDVDSETIGAVAAVLDGANPNPTGEGDVLGSNFEDLSQEEALLRYVGYTGDFSEASVASWKGIGARQKALDILSQRLASTPGDDLSEIAQHFPNLDPNYVTPCGVSKTERDAIARELGFTGMFGVYDTDDVLIPGEFVVWLANPDNEAQWQEACAAASALSAQDSQSSPASHKEVNAMTSQLATAAVSIGYGVDAVMEAYLSLFGF
ncbi:MAG TPA: hypothetical protein VD928_02550 [Candidatus Paceibacterota bacterium]|nr:hypothetical protein [Candidatus Paceibacterota bacterium]